MNDLLLRALRCENSTGRPPIWIKRQAGRYLPEFRAMRERYSFLQMCHSPELAAETTLLPIRLLGFDAAILFSDILVIPEAMGVGVHFEPGQGPLIERPLHNVSDIAKLSQPYVKQDLNFVAEAIRLLKPELKVPLIGFCGAPFTIASYMIEGGSSRDLKKTKRWMLSEPDSFHQLLGLIESATADYIELQIEAGVDAFQIFDSWAYVLAHEQFHEFSLPYLKRLVSKITVPSILFCRGSSSFAMHMASAGSSALSIDWNAHLAFLRKHIPHPVALQGNLDPDILHAPPSVIRKEVKRLLDSMRHDPGYIFNLGHGIAPDTPVDSVKILLETVKTYA